MATKQNIRQRIKARRAGLSNKTQAKAATAVFRQVISQPFFKQAQSIAFYMPTRGELSPQPILLHALKQKKAVYLPVIQANPTRLAFYRYRPQQTLNKNNFGILEPRCNAHNHIAPLALDLVFFPLVAFDKKGNRLGMGKGYYDRTFQKGLHKTKPMRIGLAYAFQQLSHVPTSKRDVPLHAIFTEKEHYFLSVI